MTLTNGIFLVRESLTIPNSYVLSIIFNDDYYHYQIQQHGEDAFFSIDSQCVQHGLDYLIDYYRKESSNLCTKLDKYVKKSPPPTNLCRSGKANLLHRATKANNLNVVKEILTTSYRNFDAKDESGMSAVHIAAINKVNPEILKILIENGATVMSRDSKGNTPMHVSSSSL
jgi:tyrosine-protein kinase shark